MYQLRLVRCSKGAGFVANEYECHAAILRPDRSADARSRHRGGDKSPARQSARRRTLGIRTGSRRDHPGRICAARHYLAEPLDPALERKFGVYLRRLQGAHGGWPLFHDGDFDMSASVKAYFALKMIGDSPDAPHMARAREAILSRGGAAHSNVFTRVLLALFGVLTWSSVPVMPVEIMLLPRWFPFHLDKISLLGAHRDRAADGAARRSSRWPRIRAASASMNCSSTPPASGTTAEGAAPKRPAGRRCSASLDSVLRVVEPCFRRALARARDRPRGRLHRPSGSTARMAWARSIPPWPTRDDVRGARLAAG